MSTAARRPPRFRRARIIVVLATLALVTACSDGDDEDATAPVDGDASTEDDDGHKEATPVAEDARFVQVRGRSFEFEPEDITVRRGEDIAVELSSEDSLHDFTIDELDAHVAAERGATSVGGVRADEAGRYTFYCWVEGHREAGMEGIVVVGGDAR